MKKTGFTLAEVLITLTIIGVIAALTIPNLMQAWKKHETEIKIKEAYSLLSNALKMAEAEHGDLTDTIPEDKSQFTSTWVDSYVLPYLKVGSIKNTYPEHVAYFLNGISSARSNNVNRPNTNRNVILQNGFILSFAVADESPRPLWIHIDINGIKKPNKYGVDIFLLLIYPNNTRITLSPLILNKGSDCIPNDNGKTCLNLIMKNGWKIPDDYPIKKF